MFLFQQDFFEKSASRFPNHAAVDDNGKILTYEALNAASNQLAHFLKTLGSGPNERICIFAEKNQDSYIGILGALKSGACWVPLNTAYPLERLRKLIESLKPRAVIVSASTLAIAQQIQEATSFEFSLIQMDESASSLETSKLFNRSSLEKFPTHTPDRTGSTPDDIAYIIFTSGSTGTPKGVTVLHRNTSQFLSLCSQFFEITAHSRFAHFSELTFDPSVFDLFYGWATGGTLVPFNRRSYRIDPGLFLREQRINVLFCIPSLIASLRDSQEIGDPAFSTIQHLLLTGEPASPKLVRQWYDAYPMARVYNMYGPAESAIVSHWHKIDAKLDPTAPVPIGHPLPGTRVYVLGEDGPVLPGEIGELAITGSQLSAGYWADDFQTRLAFVRNPLNPDLPQPVYMTRDLVRQNPENQLFYYVGRADRQVKVRGHRVELSEIEFELKNHDSVKDAAVILSGNPEKGYEHRLIAYVVTEDGEFEKSVLLAYLVKKLPSYMVPSDVVLISEALPKNTHGKVDVLALKKMAEALIEQSGVKL